MQGKHWGTRLLALSLSALLAFSALGCAGGEKAASDELWGQADAKEIDVYSKIAGRVVELNVSEGDAVKKGDVIARIDRRTLDAQRDQQAARIEALSAQITAQDAQSVRDAGTTAAATEKAAADLTRQQNEYLRYQDLLASGAVSHSLYEEKENAYRNAQAASEQASANLKQTDIDAANAAVLRKQLKEAEAALEATMVNLDETEIRAPFDGVVTTKYIEEGSMVTTGTPLVAVQDTTDNWINIKIPETQVKNFTVGQEVRLNGRDDETEVTGTVTDISKKAEFATTKATSERGSDADIISFNLKIQVDSEKLRPGMRFRLAGDDHAS